MDKKTVNTKEIAKRFQEAKGDGTTLAAAERDVRLLSKLIADAVAAGEVVRLPEFGIEKTERAERTCKNPRTGETVVVPKHFVPKFKAFSPLKAAMNPAEPKETKEAKAKAKGKGKKGKKK